MNIKCEKCSKDAGSQLIPKGWLRLEDGAERWLFCSRVCVIEWLAPDIKKVVAVRQWVPTQEEEERMRQ